MEYDGTDFYGFQFQQSLRSVQGEIETAIETRTGQQVRVTAAGRTDTGVHALGQVISFSVETRIGIDRMAIALNSALPTDVSIREIEETDETFNARFSASARLYTYLIHNDSTPSALWRRYAAHCINPLDVSAMQVAASFLPGHQDFGCFTNEASLLEHTVREVTTCRVGRWNGMIAVRIEANAFLRAMVRNIVGTLIEVGERKRDPDSIPELLASRDRKLAGPTAPPQGLCLVKVRYGERKVYPRREKIHE